MYVRLFESVFCLLLSMTACGIHSGGLTSERARPDLSCLVERVYKEGRKGGDGLVLRFLAEHTG